MSKKSKKSLATKQSHVETPKEKRPEQVVSAPQAKQEKPLTLEAVHQELDDLAQHVQHHAERILYYDTIIRRRHMMASNGSVQILDKVTGKVYPSKNSAFQSLMLVK